MTGYFGMKHYVIRWSGTGLRDDDASAATIFYVLSWHYLGGAPGFMSGAR
jgi:hypothetical protein